MDCYGLCNRQRFPEVRARFRVDPAGRARSSGSRIVRSACSASCWCPDEEQVGILSVQRSDVSIRCCRWGSLARQELRRGSAPILQPACCPRGPFRSWGPAIGWAVGIERREPDETAQAARRPQATIAASRRPARMMSPSRSLSARLKAGSTLRRRGQPQEAQIAARRHQRYSRAAPQVAASSWPDGTNSCEA